MKFDRRQRQKLLRAFLFVARLALGCLFLWSSLPKIRQPYDFLSAVYEYELVGPKLSMLVAMTLPWLELLVAICLLGGILVSGSLLASAAMAAMFTFVIASALYRGLDISCGCFGASSADTVNYSTLLRTCLILLFSLVAYVIAVFLIPAVTTRESDKIPGETQPI